MMGEIDNENVPGAVPGTNGEFRKPHGINRLPSQLWLMRNGEVSNKSRTLITRLGRQCLFNFCSDLGCIASIFRRRNETAAHEIRVYLFANEPTEQFL
jgi:hypothetical protein